MSVDSGNSIMRVRDGHEARVSYAELFFDLVYVFAVTQLSHTLLHHLTLEGAVQTLILWFAVWLVWQYTCWFTNWFDPETTPVRACLFVLMLLGLVMSAALPQAFGERGLIFAACFAAMQVGRTIFALAYLKRDNPLVPNFRRILGWSVIAACLWIAGGFAQGGWRAIIWAAAIACEYVAPMFGLWLPVLGRSASSEWTIEGGHLVERCALFVIVALGESVLVTGDTLAKSDAWNAPGLAAFLAALAGSVAMWWLYFDTSTRDATEEIVGSGDPGQFGAQVHYLHVLLLAGVIVTAVGNDLSIEHPGGAVEMAAACVIFGGPAIYLIGNALYKRRIYGRFPLSHLIGILALIIALPLCLISDLLTISLVTTVILAGVATWETCVRRGPAASRHGEVA